jgi:O-antigen/teichoic acid export membrane protein
MLAEAPVAIGAFGRLLVVVGLSIYAVRELPLFVVGFGFSGAAMAVGSYLVIHSAWRGRLYSIRWNWLAGKALAIRVMPLALQAVSVLAIARLDVLILGLTRSPEEVGAYEPVMRITQQLGSLVSSLFSAQFLPGASRLFAKGREELGDFYVLISRIGWVLTMPVLLMVGVFPRVLFDSFFGTDFPLNVTVVRILLIGLATNIALGLNALTLIAGGRRKEFAIAGAATFGSALVLGLVLIPRFGPVGAAISTTVSFVVQNVTVSVFLYRALNVSPFRQRYAFSLASGLVLLGVVAALAPAESISLLAAVAIVLGAWVSWVGLLIALGAISLRELRSLIREVPRGSRT